MFPQGTKYFYDLNSKWGPTSGSALLPNGTIAFTDGQTLKEYKESKPKSSFSAMMGDDEYNACIENWHNEQYLNKPAVRITKEDFYDKLEMLPPCGWKTYGIYEAFYMSEMITSNITNWYANDGDNYYEICARASAGLTEIKAAIERLEESE